MKFLYSISKIMLLVIFALFICNSETSYAQLRINKGNLKGKIKNKIKGSSTNSSANSSNGSSNTNSTISNIGTTEEDKVFNENKDNLINCYKYLNEFVNVRNDKAKEMAPDVPPVIKLAEKTLENISAVIPKPYSSYQKRNEEAQKMYLGSKMSFTKTYIGSAKDKLEGIKKSYIKRNRESAEWLGSEYGKIKHAPRVMNEIKTNFEALDKIFPNDAEIAEAKRTTIPLAEENYQKLLKSIENNRMASEKYTKADKASLKKKLATAYLKSYPSPEVLKVVITGTDWVTKKQLIDNNVNVYWEIADYISAQVATGNKTSAKVCVVTFKRTQQGEISLYSVGTSFTMLPQNI